MNKGKKISVRQNNRLQWTILFFIVLLYISFYLPVPYFITAPGSAMELKPIIEVKDGYKEDGEFMLLTISVGPGSVANYIYAQFHPFMETIPSEYILQEDEDPEDYSNRQLQIMKQSQQDAVINAFNYAKQPIKIIEKGALVMGLVPGYPAEKSLEVGDIITKIDDKPIKNVDDLLLALNDKMSNDEVLIHYNREKQGLVKKIRLVKIEQTSRGQTKSTVGFGLYPTNAKEVIPSKKVSFHTEDIGGPSAGLMFTLEIINQLTKEDLTKGYKIAGTGEILADGKVGQIGGANLKVKAAVDKGADIFFVPKDINDDDKNEKDAQSANQSLGDPLEIVPVTSVDDVIKYLKKLPTKTTN